MDNEQRKHLEDLRQAHLKRLQVLELKEAQFGMNAPPEILTEMEDVRERIASIDIQLTNIREINDIRSRQEEQAQEIKLLRFFIANFIGKFELKHLEGLERGRPYPFDSVPWTFEEELVRLRSFGLIDHIRGKGIVAMKQEGQGDLNDHFRITDLGKEYLKLRREIASAVKASAESDSE